MVHNTCNPDTTLAPETPEWQWLADVTPKYMFRRAMTLWMKKHRQEDKDGAPTAMAPSPFVQPSVVQAIQGVQQVCSGSTVVSAGSTVRLNRLHRLQPCTVQRHLPTH